VTKRKKEEQQQKTLWSTKKRRKRKTRKDVRINKAILFSGMPKDWLASWMEKFLAKARRKGLKEIYLRDPTSKIPTATELEALYATKAADKILIDLSKSNEDAYAELTMLIDTTTNNNGRNGSFLYSGINQNDGLPGW
jgi:hypothetical protein